MIKGAARQQSKRQRTQRSLHYTVYKNSIFLVAVRLADAKWHCRQHSEGEPVSGCHFRDAVDCGFGFMEEHQGKDGLGVSSSLCVSQEFDASPPGLI